MGKISKDKRKFTQNIVYVGLCSIIMALQKVLLVPILTKTLGVQDYGAWTNIVNTAMLLGVISSLGLGPTFIRLMSSERNKQTIRKSISLVFLILFISGTVFSFISFLLSDIVAILILKDIHYSFFIKLSSLLVLLEAGNLIAMSIYKGLKLFKSYTVIYILHSLSEFLLILSLLVFGLGFTGVILSTIFLKLLLVCGSLLVFKSKIGISFPDIKKISYFLKFGIHLILLPLYNWVIRVSDQYIIGFFLGPKMIGIYSLHYSLAYMLFNLTYVVIFVLAPIMTQYWEEQKLKKLRMYVSFSYKYLAMILIPSIIGYVVLYEGIIRNFSTAEFLASNILLMILSISVIFGTLHLIFQNLLLLFKKTRIINYIMLSGALLNIFLNILIVPYFGINGAAFSTLFTFIILVLLDFIFLNKLYKFDFMPGTLLKFTIAGLIMGIGISYYPSISLLSILLKVFAGTLFYFIFIYMLKGITKSEIKFFISFYKK